MFSPSEAAELDNDEMHRLGLSGLTELQSHDPSLAKFEKLLFIRTSTEFRREQQTAEVIRVR
jgi:hypothetical protein